MDGARLSGEEKRKCRRRIDGVFVCRIVAPILEGGRAIRLPLSAGCEGGCRFVSCAGRLGVGVWRLRPKLVLRCRRVVVLWAPFWWCCFKL